jgi:ABC-2 type transport system permease protein
VVAEQECRDLWWGGRGPVLLLAFSILLSVVTYLTATNNVLNYLEQRETVSLTVQIAIAVGALLTLIVSADGISGARWRCCSSRRSRAGRSRWESSSPRCRSGWQRSW